MRERGGRQWRGAGEAADGGTLGRELVGGKRGGERWPVACEEERGD